MSSWRLEGVLAEIGSMRQRQMFAGWPKLPLNILPHEREEALAIAARMDQEVVEFLTTYPEYREVFEGRRNGAERRTRSLSPRCVP